MNRIKSALLYAGLEPERFNELLPEACEENGSRLTVYSSVMAAVFAICLLAGDVADKGLTVNNLIYASMIAVSFVLYTLARAALPKHPGMSTPLSIACVVALYGYAIGVSLQRPAMQGTAAVAIVLVMPSLFNYRPIYMIAMTLIEGTIFCALSSVMKVREAAMLDLWNTLFFASIAILLSVFQMQVKFRLLLQKRENRRLSERDLLTGTRNRNCFECLRESYIANCRERLACVFVDANGLHELNDRWGHEAGDQLLIAVAKAITTRFGEQDTYRIGGDEFLVLCQDANAGRVQEGVRGIAREVGEQGYSVSVGMAIQERAELNLHRLVKEAERQMYEEKRRYYEQGGHDRRAH